MVEYVNEEETSCTYEVMLEHMDGVGNEILVSKLRK